MIRYYKKGDLKGMLFNNIGKAEWRENPDESGLEKEGYTIVIGNYKCVLAVEPMEHMYYIWFTPDKRISSLYLRDVKRIIEAVAHRGKKLFTLSHGGKKQEKMHKFLGCVDMGKTENRTIWVYKRR